MEASMDTKKLADSWKIDLIDDSSMEISREFVFQTVQKNDNEINFIEKVLELRHGWNVIIETTAKWHNANTVLVKISATLQNEKTLYSLAEKVDNIFKEFVI